MLAETPFHARTSRLVRAQTWRRWAGHQVASAYDPQPDREYAAIRNSAALIDVSPLYKYRVAGPDAERLLDRMVTRDVTKCAVGQVLYTPWCDAHGKVVDDGTVSRLDETTWRLTSADPNLRWLTMNAHGMDVRIEDVSRSTAALALQGPLSRAILEQLTPEDLSALRYFRLTHTTLNDISVTISRTGYTGDLGYEIWVPAGKAVAVWDAVVDAGAAYGIVPAGIWALDIARIEAGLVMLDVDYFSAHHAMIEDQKSSPYELNLGWTVSDTKGPFNGRQALRDEKKRGPSWSFIGLEVDWVSFERLHLERGLAPHVPNIAWRASAPIMRRGSSKQVGYATSGTWSPLLKRYIALGHLGSSEGKPGTELELEMTIEHRRKRVKAVVRKLPFFDPARMRA
ncbi:MAG: aminomethyltransferase family protein [Gemmatimonadaceae bacterium]